MKKLNNKGYMLVEIILAFAIAFSIVYFIMDLVIRLKSKNDDLMVETLVRTDQTIITNKLMEYAIDEEKEFDCNLLKQGITDTRVSYRNQLIVAVNKYSKIDKSRVSCENNYGKVSITIPLEVKQMEDDFDIDIDYKYGIGDMVPPTCSLSVSGTTINASSQDNDGGTGVKYAGWNSTYTGESSTTRTINSTGTYTYYVSDEADNTTTCSLSVIGTTSEQKNAPIETNAYERWEPRGTCLCRSDGTHPVDYYVDCQLSGCHCPGAFMWRDNCYNKHVGYYCDPGSTLSGSKCVEDNYYTVYNCQSGYSKINDNYCYKLG